LLDSLCCGKLSEAGRVDRGCWLGVVGEEMFGEDYQVFLPDGWPLGQMLVLECRDPAAGGKQVQPQTSILLKI